MRIRWLKKFSISIKGLEQNSKIHFVSNSKYAKGDFLVLSPTNPTQEEKIKKSIETNHIIGIIGTKNEIKKYENYDIILLACDNPRKIWASLCKQKFPLEPAKKIAITGTNGKTSTTYFIHQILQNFGKNSILIGSNGIYENCKLIMKTPNTSPDPYIFNKALHSFTKKFGSNSYAVFEATSIALDQERLAFTAPDIGIWLNFSQDHLDYHKNMKKYWQTKANLGEICKKFLIHNSVPIIGKINPYSTYGKELTKCLQKEKLKIEYDFGKKYEVEVNMIGDFQAENLLAAILALKKLGFMEKEIMEKLTNLKSPEGRMEMVDNIAIDFAHTPDALEKSLKILRKMKPNRLFCLFGAGGNRDTKKRKIMGEIAQKYADKIIITSDNPRNEDPLKIINEIAQNCPKAIKIKNRKNAIKYLIQIIEKNDLCLVAGRGNEEFQIQNDRKIKFKDREIIENFLAQKTLILK